MFQQVQFREGGVLIELARDLFTKKICSIDYEENQSCTFFISLLIPTVAMYCSIDSKHFLTKKSTVILCPTLNSGDGEKFSSCVRKRAQSVVDSYRYESTSRNVTETLNFGVLLLDFLVYPNVCF